MTTAIARPQATALRPRPKLGRMLVIAAGALALACGGAQAQGHGGGYHGGYHGGGWGAGPFWGGIGLGVGLGLYSSYYYYDRPDYVVVSQPPVYYVAPPAPVYATPQPAAPVAAPAVDPIFYPRSGQSAEQTEADRQACNRWATTVPRAMADASVFQRATLACMDGRGYTAR